MSKAAMSSTERGRKHRLKLKRKGYRQVLARIDPGASAALSALKSRNPTLSMSQIINDALKFYVENRL